jgi:cation transport regulator ChaC
MVPATYVFGYGSLVSPASVTATLGHDGPGFDVARLHGWRRAWNVGSDGESHPERTFVRPDGSVFGGITVVLGLIPADGGCGGAVFGVTPADLALLDVRERNYDRVDVSDRVDWPARPAGCTVLTYLPRRRAVARLHRAVAGGREVVVREQYLRLVEDAFAATGRLDDYRRSTPAPEHPVEDLRIVTGPPAVPEGLEQD